MWVYSSRKWLLYTLASTVGAIHGRPIALWLDFISLDMYTWCLPTKTWVHLHGSQCSSGDVSCIYARFHTDVWLDRLPVVSVTLSYSAYGLSARIMTRRLWQWKWFKRVLQNTYRNPCIVHCWCRCQILTWRFFQWTSKLWRSHILKDCSVYNRMYQTKTFFVLFYQVFCHIAYFYLA